ncbi:MAG: hypothetical protein ACI84E_000671 [Planctomycetota bacterium]|jgi:hypothetical protein
MTLGDLEYRFCSQRFGSSLSETELGMGPVIK